jgi:hypothetical protein
MKLFQEWRGGEDKGEWWRGWTQVWYICNIIRTFVNATTQHNNPKMPCHKTIESFKKCHISKSRDRIYPLKLRLNIWDAFVSV